MLDSEVESVTVRLANLELTITARPVSPSTEPASSTSVSVSAASVESTTEPVPFYNIGEGLEDRIIGATTPEQFESLRLLFLGIFTSRLRSAGAWTPQARIARAYRAGIVARRQLGGQYQGGVSPGTPFRNTVYVVLRAGATGDSFWTSSYAVYLAAVCVEVRNHRFHPDSVSHAFASQAEAAAYLAGAHRQWPAERQQ
eukprot:Skav204925  [mRNA]  locus=scaffold526:124833:125429:+ [translate_table: standard]